MKRILFLAVLATMGCTQAQCSQVTAYGSSAKVECYSGGKLIYSGVSTGKVATEEQSDGWYFREEGTGNLIRVSGDCVIRN